MFAYVKGRLIQTTPLSVIIESGGIGYKIFIPASVFSKLPQIKEEIVLHTSFVIRENSQTLYGFMTSQDCELFEALMGVSGIGPKLALSLIGHLSGHDMHLAISNHDIKTISKVPGIGKKTAERLIIEMRDKISHLLPIDPTDYAVQAKLDPESQKINDAMSALINLGYNQITAQKAIKKALKDSPESIDLTELITGALKNASFG